MKNNLFEDLLILEIIKYRNKKYYSEFSFIPKKDGYFYEELRRELHTNSINIYYPELEPPKDEE